MKKFLDQTNEMKSLVSFFFSPFPLHIGRDFGYDDLDLWQVWPDIAQTSSDEVEMP